jgi:hypothetical protein
MEFEQPQEDSVSFSSHLNVRLPCYPGQTYADFGQNKPLYKFMSEPNFEFAEFMKKIPTHQYLRILEAFAFNEDIRSTTDDGFNYYGEKINRWYPEFIQLMELAGINVDLATKKLIYNPAEIAPPADELFSFVFGDVFLDRIRIEANDANKSQLYLSVAFLTRKMIEVVAIRLLEVVFPKLVSGAYDANNHDLWFDRSKGTYRGLSSLLETIKLRANHFHEDENLVLKFHGLAEPLRKEANACVHCEFAQPDGQFVAKYRFAYAIQLAHRLFRKYCNP